jgi:alcohol dehydrogenase class IV
MVTHFTFNRLPEIYFGPGRIELLPKKVKTYGSKILLVTGKSSFLRSQKGDWLLKKLASDNVTVEILKISGEPSVQFIDEACQTFKSHKADVIVSIGGGSAIDAGKAISAMLKVEGSVRDFTEGSPTFRAHTGIKLPFIAVPTTSGTGSEATRNAVLSEVGEQGFKRSIRHENFVPDIAIIDPELTLNCPPDITAAGGLDAFTQLLEGFTSANAFPMSDALAYEGIAHVVNSLLKVYHDGKNIEGRCSMSYAALLSGIVLNNAGLGAIHGFASSIGGFFDIPHGVICGTLMGAVNRKNIEKLIECSADTDPLSKYARVGKLFCNESDKSEMYYIQALPDAIENLIEELNIQKLGRYGIINENIEKIAANTSVKSNPVQLNKEELAEILRSRI